MQIGIHSLFWKVTENSRAKKATHMTSLNWLEKKSHISSKSDFFALSPSLIYYK